MAKTRNATSNDLWDHVLGTAEQAIPVEGFDKHAEIAKLIYEAEVKRKETIEGKASTIAQAAGGAIALISLVPALSEKPWKLSTAWILIAGGVYLLAIMHFLVAMYYATKVRGVGEMAVRSAGDLLKAEVPSAAISRRCTVYDLARSKWNEDYLIDKSNNLMVAELLLLRGIAFVSLSALITGAFHLLSVHSQ